VEKLQISQLCSKFRGLQKTVFDDDDDDDSNADAEIYMYL